MSFHTPLFFHISFYPSFLFPSLPFPSLPFPLYMNSNLKSELILHTANGFIYNNKRNQKNNRQCSFPTFTSTFPSTQFH
ncbi:unnamed protein product [Periconia digitata]|uniref:Uncharacterized protein n=1 Tax=Periconia digitata TaxID=1303443 RepID=A0A9W4U265_9PLEO|nr:unnamed protein product [Periconia digitata]